MTRVSVPASRAWRIRARPERRLRAILLFPVLAVALAALTILAIGRGPLVIAPVDIIDILVRAAQGVDQSSSREALVVLDIRLPRILLAVVIGANLAVSGALMQSLFRNPLADPGIIGVSAGAALAAAGVIVVGDKYLPGALPFASLPIAAFAGALIAVLILYLIATRGRETSVATLLLAGIALGALAGAIIGFLTFVADDRQLRDLTFWSLGSLGGATWDKVAALTPPFVLLLVALPFLGRGLNALSIGEAEAFYLGISVQRLKAAIVALAALATGASVAAAGIIGFVGIVVPQLLRLVLGPDHRFLLPACALLGPALLLAADTCARTLAAPAELPIGILTAGIGAPFFLWLLLRRPAGFDT
ncbi:MAG: iron chelate uptake ABC transporter family permease subunit [Pseudomonadota bacterium]